MKVLRAYKVELDANNSQASLLTAYCGAVRYICNWALEQKIAAFQKREKMPSSFTLAKQLRAVRSDLCPWLSEYSSCVIDSNLPRVDKAFDNFFRRCKEGKKGKKGFPKFRSRKNGIGSCSFHKAYSVSLSAIRLPKIGLIRFKESGYIPVTGTEGMKFYSATVSEKAGRWFVAVQVEVEIPEPCHKTKAPVGVDFGVSTLAVCSDGRRFANPKAYRAAQRKLTRLQRTVCRRQKGSRNREKAKKAVAKIHARIANIRASALHQISYCLTRENQAVVIEDLNVQGMVKNRRLAAVISDCGFGELRRQLEYKGLWYGCDVVVADRFYPSSKTCSNCGTVKETLGLSERMFRCDCGFSCDRDLNAAMNLKKLAGTASASLNACGEEGAGLQSIASETGLSEAGTQHLVLFGQVSA